MTVTAAHTTVSRQYRPGGHPDWCARGHRCGLGEHRSAPITLDRPGRGVVVLTRVLAADGREHAEIRLRVALAPGGRARSHLGLVVSGLASLLSRVARPPG